MAIVSVSLNPALLKDIDRVQKEMGFTGKSEIVRAGLRLLLDDNRQKARLKGIVDGVMMIVHDDNYQDGISAIRHEYQGIIKTHIHQHIESGKCLEIIVIKGRADDVKVLYDILQKNRYVSMVKLVLP